jgi:chromosomal replication initiator protein
MMMSPEAAWKATLGELEMQMTKATFNTWLKDSRLVACNGDEYVIAVRNDYARDWLEHRLKDTIARTLASMAGGDVSLKFSVLSDNGQTNGHDKKLNGHTQVSHKFTVTSPEAAAENGRFPLNAAPSTHLNARFTFANFIVGNSNRLAHAAALSVAENPGKAYNPLFIYGGVGLGKTHLLHAIGHRCRQDGLTVCYISSETFTNDLISSIRNKQMEQFRERYRTPDVLMIDDIQFIAGKESTQEELFHTFNELHSHGKQIVISSDRPPKAMVTLEERLQSRFEWGLMADIQQPDVETRRAILQTKAEELGLDIPSDVIETIAHRIQHNIRELEGALNKVAAYGQLTGGHIDDRILQMALGDLIGTPEKVTVSQVIDAVCRHYNVTREALVGKGRSRAIAVPRQMAMYLARMETDASLPQIGNALGGRDHSTVLYGYEKVATLVETHPDIRREMLAIKTMLYESMA